MDDRLIRNKKESGILVLVSQSLGCLLASWKTAPCLIKRGHSASQVN